MNTPETSPSDILKSVCESLSDGVVVADTQGKFLIFNPAAEEMVGIGMLDVSPEEWSRNYGIYLPDQKTIYPDQNLPLARAIRGENVQEAEAFIKNFKKQKGVWLSVNARPIRDEKGVLLGGVAIFRDITERKHFEELKQNYFKKLEKEFLQKARILQEIISLLQATLESTADGILVVDQTGKMVRFNQKFIEMWSVPIEILAARDDKRAIEFVLNQLEDPEDFLNKVQELYSQPEAESFDILKFKDGKIFERYSQPQKIDEKTVGRVWSFRDVTKQKIAEQEVKKKTEELARSNKELEQFAYVASHDLQEPLHKIVAFSDLIQEIFSDQIDEKLHDYFQRMQRSASRMRDLIDDLLQFARITTQAKPFEEIDLKKIVEEILAELDYRIKESKAEIQVGALPNIYADRRQIYQLILNLLSNALKFHQKGKSPKIKIEGKQEKENIQITISDRGIGFDEKYCDRIFQPFQRLHGKSEYEGSGMGLALCQKIVERHGGNILVTSEVGKGTEFVVKFPGTH